MLPVRLYLFIVLLCIAIPSIGQDDQNQNTASSKNHTELKAAKEEIHKLQREVDRLSLQIENQKGHQAKDIAWVNKRVDDFNTGFNYYGAILGVISLVIPFLLVIIANRYKTEAIATAKDTSTDITEKYYKLHAEKLDEITNKEINKFNNNANDRLSALDSHNKNAESIISTLNKRIHSIEGEKTTLSSVTLNSHNLDSIFNAAINKNKGLLSFLDCYALTIKYIQKREFIEAEKYLKLLKAKSVSYLEGIYVLKIESHLLYFNNNFQSSLEKINEALSILESANRKNTEEIHASLLLDKATMLGALNDNESELNFYNDFLQQYSDLESIKEYVAIAFLNKAIILASMEKPIEELHCYDQVIQRFIDNTGLKTIVAQSIVYKGATLNELDRFEEAITQYELFFQKFQYSDELRTQTVQALLNKGIAHRHLNQHNEALSLFEKILGQFGSDEQLQSFVQKAMLNKARSLSQQNKSTEAKQQLVELFSRFGERSEPEFKEILRRAKTLLNQLQNPNPETPEPQSDQE